MCAGLLFLVSPLRQPIIDNPNSLLSGDHTRTICKPTPTARKGGIMMFAVKTLQCLGCKCPISDEEATLCGRCRPKEAEIFMTKAFKVCLKQEEHQPC